MIVEKSKFEYGTDIVKLNESHSQHLCLTPGKILQTLIISCLMKCQSRRNYT